MVSQPGTGAGSQPGGGPGLVVCKQRDGKLWVKTGYGCLADGGSIVGAAPSGAKSGDGPLTPALSQGPSGVLPPGPSVPLPGSPNIHIGNPITSVTDFLNRVWSDALGNPEFWKASGLVFAGAGMVAIGVFIWLRK